MIFGILVKNLTFSFFWSFLLIVSHYIYSAKVFSPTKMRLMSKEKLTLDNFKKKALTEEACKSVKGGYKSVPGIPGGSGSNGQVDWGELEIRVEPDPVAWTGGISHSKSIG